MGLVYRGEYGNPHMVELELELIDARLSAIDEAQSASEASECGGLDTDLLGVFPLAALGSLSEALPSLAHLLAAELLNGAQQ